MQNTVSLGLYSHGKSGEKCPFHLGQEKSGKPAIVRGTIALLYCRSGKIFHF